MPAADSAPPPVQRSPHSGEDRFRLLVETVQDYAIFMLDRGGIVSSWNTGAQRIKGYAASEIIGKPFTVFYQQEDVDRGWPQEELRQAALQGRFEDEGWRVRKDGTRFWANVIITALRDERGEVYGFAKITRDLSERKRNEEMLRRSEERFRLLVDNVRDYAVFMLDPEGRIESWNIGAQNLNRYGASEVIGRHFSIFYTAEDMAQGKPQRQIDEAMRTGRAIDEGWSVRKDGSVFWACVVLTAVHDEEGRLRGFAQVTRDMTEQRRLAELEHSARRISEFLAMLGHELRNPLAPIRNAVSIMQLHPAFPSSLRQNRDIIDRQLTHITHLVDDLLDVGRITTGRIALKRELLNWQEIVLRAAEAVRFQIDARHHTLDLQVQPEPVWVQGDPTRLIQILQNVLGNAAKYTAEGGRIQILMTVHPTIVETRIVDNGRGIDPDALDGIFELFVQGRSEALVTDGGLGIGLALARTLAQLHGGTLEARSDGPGQGSTFILRLPRALHTGPSERPPATQQPQAAATGYRILVVDDNRDSADTMTELMAAMGHPARAVYNGDDAVIVAQSYRPQLILLDLNMPGRDGFSVLKDLRAIPSIDPMHIVAMTGYGQETDRTRSLESGFDGHLTKPVDAGQLQGILARAQS